MKRQRLILPWGLLLTLATVCSGATPDGLVEQDSADALFSAYESPAVPGVVEMPPEPDEVTDLAQDKRLYDLELRFQQLQQRFDTESGRATLPATLTTPQPATKFPTANLNGVFQADSIWFRQDEENRDQLGDIQDGAGFRRTRLGVSGALAKNANYFLQLDFAFFGKPTFTDVWVEVTDVPGLGNVRVGQWKQPFSLEVPTSFRYQTFWERSVLFQAFEPFRHIGAGFYDHNADETLTWAVSAFRVGQDQFGNDIGDPGGWSTAGRFTYLPYYCASGHSLNYLHLGAAGWVGDPANNSMRYATIPEAYVGAYGVPAGTVPGSSTVQVPTIANGTPPFVDTGTLPINMFVHNGVEALWVHGPFSWQTEAQIANASMIGGPTLQFWGYYSQVSYFLTGESRPYNRKLAVMDRVVPLRPVLITGNEQKGPGAWEFAIRSSYIDLNDATVSGGSLHDLTIGMNWYLSGNLKFQFNYIHASLDREPFDHNAADIFGVRCQMDF